MYFDNHEDLKLSCPRCKSENIFVGESLDIKPDDEIRCNDCSYSHIAHEFQNKWESENNKEN